jgi:hypothetical protein
MVRHLDLFLFPVRNPQLEGYSLNDEKEIYRHPTEPRLQKGGTPSTPENAIRFERTFLCGHIYQRVYLTPPVSNVQALIRRYGIAKGMCSYCKDSAFFDKVKKEERDVWANIHEQVSVVVGLDDKQKIRALFRSAYNICNYFSKREFSFRDLIVTAHAETVSLANRSEPLLQVSPKCRWVYGAAKFYHYGAPEG